MRGDAKYWRLGLFVLAAIAVVIAGVVLLSSGIFSGGASVTLAETLGIEQDDLVGL